MTTATTHTPAAGVGLGRLLAAGLAGGALAAAVNTALLLAGKALLRRDATGRYVVHELTRHFAGKKLQASGEETRLHAEHFTYYLKLAELAAPQLKGAEQARWLNRLEQEQDNLRAALEWAVGYEGGEPALRLATALYPFWYWRCHFNEGRGWLQAALAPADVQQTTPRSLRPQALWSAGVLSEMQSDDRHAAQLYWESLNHWRELNDQRGLATALNSLGCVTWRQLDYAQAEALFVESLALRRGQSEGRALAIPLSNLGLVALAQGEYARAEALFAESLALDRTEGDGAVIASDLCNLGRALLARDEHAAARACFAESLRILQEVMDQDGLADCLEGLVEVVLAHALEHHALTSGERADAERAALAARLLGAAEGLREHIGAPILPPLRPFHARSVAQLRAALDAPTLLSCWMAGRALSPEQAIEHALATATS